MSQNYSDPSRENEPYSLPDIEVFYVSPIEATTDWGPNEDGESMNPGWYWWPCFPGCLPDGDPMGPFETEKEALADAQDYE